MESKRIKYLCPVCEQVSCKTVFSLVKHLLTTHIEDTDEVDASPARGNDDCPHRTTNAPTKITDSQSCSAEATVENEPEDPLECSMLTNERISNDISSTGTASKTYKAFADNNDSDKSLLEEPADEDGDIASGETLEDINDTTLDMSFEEVSIGDIKTGSNDDHKALEDEKIVVQVVKTEDGSFQCCICLNTFPSKKLANAHLQSDHNLQHHFQCKICSRFFARKSRLKTHIRTIHEGRKDFQCETCSRHFALKAYLVKHIKAVHTMERDHHCKVCSHSFTQRSHLVRHLRTVHKAERDFQCEICSSSFKQRAYLEKHIETVHNRRRDFLCEKCSNSFTCKASLVQHIKTVHDLQRDFQCEICSKKFAHKSYIKRHITAVHGGRKKKK